MNPEPDALLTDFYELTMLQVYAAERMEETAVFEFFVRQLPPQRNFLIAAGLEQVLAFLESFRFRGDELEWLERQGGFPRDFIRYLERLRFEGDVEAMPEGTVFFANEPILRVTAPLPQAQVVETRIINLLQYQTAVASKAARCVLAAPGKTLVDFGLRRAHGAEAGLLAARACYLAGFAATSNVRAAREFNLPTSGTMAHSFVQACESEIEAFRRFARNRRSGVILLLDTFNTRAAARKVAQLAPELRAAGITIDGVRLDSGDLVEQAREVRGILDAAGLTHVRIVASGNIDEYELQRCVAAGAPIDAFGVGTRVVTSADAPYLDCAYKLQEYAGRLCFKQSEGKATWPGRKQVFRSYDRLGALAGDTVALETERLEGEPLLIPVMRGGQRVGPAPPLSEVRDYTARQLARLPAALRDLGEARVHPVRISAGLRDAAAASIADLRSRAPD